MSLLRADAIELPLADDSVDLIVTSPPYFALRSYTDGGEHYDGQIGAEETPRAFLEALWAVTAECKRVLKPTGSMFVNLGDKYAGSGGHNNSNLPGNTSRSTVTPGAARRQAPDRYNQAADVPRKSLMGLPWLYALGCTGALAGLGGADPGLDLTLRAEIVWSKLNGLPESVNDRVRRTHEQFFHMTKGPAYFANIDEIRESHAATTVARAADHRAPESGRRDCYPPGTRPQSVERIKSMHPHGALPRSVWEMASEPLVVPEHLDVDHFAAFPTEWPRRLVLAWSPTEVCTRCEEGRRSVKHTPVHGDNNTDRRRSHNSVGGERFYERQAERAAATTTTVECACPDTTAPTRPAVVLDPFGGTGTTAMVANALGRYGISVDLSADYLRLARWRIHESGHARKAIARTWSERQGALL